MEHIFQKPFSQYVLPIPIMSHKITQKNNKHNIETYYTYTAINSISVVLRRGFGFTDGRVTIIIIQKNCNLRLTKYFTS